MDRNASPPASPTAWYSYALVRVVPHVERGECINVGVVLYCQDADFLEAVWQVEPERLRALHPEIDVDLVCEGLAFIDGVCAGDERGGPAAGEPIGTRFGSPYTAAVDKKTTRFTRRSRSASSSLTPFETFSR